MILLALAMASAQAGTCVMGSTESLQSMFNRVTCDVVIVPASYNAAILDHAGALLVGRAVTLQTLDPTNLVVDLPRLGVTSVANQRGGLTIGAGFRVNGVIALNSDLAVVDAEVADVAADGSAVSIASVAILGVNGADVTVSGLELSGFRQNTPIAVFGSALHAQGIVANDDTTSVIVAGTGVDELSTTGHLGDPWSIEISDSDFADDTWTAGAVYGDGCRWGGTAHDQCTPTASTLVIQRTTFTRCGAQSADFYVGGAVSVFGAALDVADSTFAQNRSVLAGGAMFGYLSDLVVTGSRFIDNATDGSANTVASSRGGAIAVIGGSLAVTGTANASVVPDFSGNSATGPGGAIYGNAAAIRLDATAIEGCNACASDDADLGGGVAIAGNGTLDLHSVGLSHLRASWGGGVYATNGTVTVSGGTFADDRATSADGAGGGLYARASTVALKDDLAFDADVAVGRGGGAGLDECAASVNSVAFTGDHANRGAGIAVRGGSIEVIGTSTFASDAANVSGGAIDAEAGAVSPYLRVNGVHITDVAAPSGGAIAVRGGSLDLAWTVVEGVSGPALSGDGASVDIGESGFYAVDGRAIDLVDTIGPSLLAVRGTAFVAGTSAVGGTGVHLVGATFDISGTAFEALRGADGTAVFVGDRSAGRLADVRFLGINTAGGSDAAATVAIDGAGAVAIERAYRCGGAGPAFRVAAGDGDVSLRNVAVYGGSGEGLIVAVPHGSGVVDVENATFARAPAPRVRVDGGALTLRNAIVQGDGTGVDAASAAAVSLAYVLFDVPVDTTGGVAVGEGSLDGAAGLRLDGGSYGALVCTRDGVDARAMWLADGSLARDAGDPALRDRYVGNGRSDMGAYGGALSGLPDSDSDGWGDDIDCAIDDPTIHGPGAYDVPGDGIDQDCDGSDAVVDTDADTGGEDTASPAGRYWLTGGGGCDTVPGNADGLGLIAMGIGLIARRRTRARAGVG